MRLLRFVLVLVGLCVVAIFSLRIAFPLPDRPDVAATRAIPGNAGTTLGAAVTKRTAAHEEKSGVVSLFDGRDALVARILLARRAEETIDAQYYIWQTDTTGWLLLDELRAAAER